MKKLKILAAGLALLLALECAYCVAAFTDWVPPLSNLRSQFIETALGTMNHKWLAAALFPGDIVRRVYDSMASDRNSQIGQNSAWNPGESQENSNFFELFIDSDEPPAEGWEHFYVNQSSPEDSPTPYRTRQGDPILAIDGANGLVVVRIREEFFRGVLILARDPHRLSCAAAENWGTIGQTAGEIARDNGALVALTASGFDATGPEGAYQTGAAMCGGIPWGEHLKPGYKRLELRRDDRLYIVDAPTPFHPDCTDATEWTPALIIDGKTVVTRDDHYNARNPRCCLGQRADGTILMLCIEGRYLDSLGATAPECAEILARYGAFQAMNLDGGTSAICWYDGQYITRCSDPELPEGRLLPNAWIYGGIEN